MDSLFDGKTHIPEIDKMFEHDPIDITLKKALEGKLSKVRSEPKSSDLLILPREEPGENWLQALGITPEPLPYLNSTDPEAPEISISIAKTNIPEVFLKTQARLKDGKVTTFKSLIIQSEVPASI